ncbi:PorT family protein [Flavobacterium sp.]|uniref:PorT family protein n=1 Tax=Flavobacterium sp. TaxID=239 RepID=UPI0037512AF7
MKKSFFTVLLLAFATSIFAQYQNKDGNRIGISGGVNQSTLYTSNFTTKPGNGYAGGLSVRGNYYNNWSMIYGMQFFVNKFSLETISTSLKKDTEFNLQGVQVRLLLSYNIIKDHISVDFGPVLQVNGKLGVDSRDENNLIKGTLLQSKQILDVSKINGNAYFGISAGGKVVRAVIFYEYGFTNVLGNLNSVEGLTLLNGNKSFKGNIGTISGQIIFNL